MNNSRVVVLVSVLKRLFRVESSVYLKFLLIAFSGDERTKRGGEAPVCKLKRSSICLAIFPIRGW